MIYIWLKLTVKFGKSMKAFSGSTRISWLESSMTSGPQFNIKKTSYQYRKSHCGDKTILRPSYLHNGISYTGKITSLYWIRALKKVAKIEKFSQAGMWQAPLPYEWITQWYISTSMACLQAGAWWLWFSNCENDMHQTGSWSWTLMCWFLQIGINGLVRSNFKL